MVGTRNKPEAHIKLSSLGFKDLNEWYVKCGMHSGYDYGASHSGLLQVLNNLVTLSRVGVGRRGLPMAVVPHLC